MCFVLDVSACETAEALHRALAAQGAHVIITARTAADLAKVEQQIFEAGGSATIAPLDPSMTFLPCSSQM